MTIDEIKAIVRPGGRYRISYCRNSRQYCTVVILWALWDVGEIKQGYGAPGEPVLATADQWILLHEVIAITPNVEQETGQSN